MKKAAAERDFAQIAVLDDLARLLQRGSRALHGAGLDHAPVLARRLHHLRAFFDMNEGRRLHVDVLTCFAGFHRNVRAPLVRGGDANRVHGWVRQNLPKILPSFHSVKAKPPGLSLGALKRGSANIADGRDPEAGNPGRIRHVPRAHPAHSDECHIDLLIRATGLTREDVTREEGGRRARGFEKLPAVWGILCHDLCCIRVQPGIPGILREYYPMGRHPWFTLIMDQAGVSRAMRKCRPSPKNPLPLLPPSWRSMTIARFCTFSIRPSVRPAIACCSRIPAGARLTLTKNPGSTSICCSPTSSCPT